MSPSPPTSLASRQGIQTTDRFTDRTISPSLSHWTAGCPYRRSSERRPIPARPNGYGVTVLVTCNMTRLRVALRHFLEFKPHLRVEDCSGPATVRPVIARLREPEPQGCLIRPWAAQLRRYSRIDGHTPCRRRGAPRERKSIRARETRRLLMVIAVLRRRVRGNGAQDGGVAAG